MSIWRTVFPTKLFRRFGNYPILTWVKRDQTVLLSNVPKTTLVNNEKGNASERIRAFMREYGRLGLGVYLSISVVSVTSIYTALKAGFDMEALLKNIGISPNGMLDRAGTIAVAYGIHKLLLPIRLLLTAAITRTIRRRFPRITN